MRWRRRQPQRQTIRRSTERRHQPIRCPMRWQRSRSRRQDCRMHWRRSQPRSPQCCLRWLCCRRRPNRCPMRWLRCRPRMSSNRTRWRRCPAPCCCHRSRWLRCRTPSRLCWMQWICSRPRPTRRRLHYRCSQFRQPALRWPGHWCRKQPIHLQTHERWSLPRFRPAAPGGIADGDGVGIDRGGRTDRHRGAPSRIGKQAIGRAAAACGG